MIRHFTLNVKLFIIAYFTGSMCPTPRGLSVAYISISFGSLIVWLYNIAYDHYQNELRCDVSLNYSLQHEVLYAMCACVLSIVKIERCSTMGHVSFPITTHGTKILIQIMSFFHLNKRFFDERPSYTF